MLDLSQAFSVVLGCVQTPEFTPAWQDCSGTVLSAPSEVASTGQRQKLCNCTDVLLKCSLLIAESEQQDSEDVGKTQTPVVLQPADMGNYSLLALKWVNCSHPLGWIVSSESLELAVLSTYPLLPGFLLLQIIMYLLSRILFGLSRLAVEKGYIPQPKQDPFPLVAALVWGTVLWLFEYHKETLQPSLQSSMTYLYEDSEVWHDLSDFLIYNKRTDSK